MRWNPASRLPRRAARSPARSTSGAMRRRLRARCHGEILRQSRRAMLGMVLREPVGVVVDHHAVELPVPDRQPEAAVCTGRRLHGGGEAERDDLGLDLPARRASARSRPAGRRRQHPRRPRHRSRRAACRHPLVDMVSFTGSTRVGKLTMAVGGAVLKKVSMELGGKNGQIVFPDADLEAAADAAVFGGFFNAGECCNAGSRLIVHEDIADDFLAAVSA